MEQTVAQKPKPARGQVWSFALRNCDEPDVIVGILSNPYSGDYAQMARGTQPLTDHMTADPRWRCVGVETPHGRVMVGERYALIEVLAVLDSESVMVRYSATGHVDRFMVRDIPMAERWTAEQMAMCSPVAPLVPGPEAAKDGGRAPYVTRADLDAAALAPFASMPADMFKRTQEWAQRQIERAILGSAPSASRETRITSMLSIFAADRNERDRKWEKQQAIVRAATDPRAEREARRKAIDAVLAEDARRFPAFATARRCAVMALLENAPPSPPEDLIEVADVSPMLVRLRFYEEQRGAGRVPVHTSWPAVPQHILAAYERARSL